MIYSAVNTVKNAINDYFQNRYNVLGEKVIVSNLVNPDGSVAVTEPDTIVMTVVNIEPETVSHKGKMSSKDILNLNIYVLFSASFTELNYQDGLKYLSGVFAYFHSNRALNHSNTPDMEPGIDKITFEIVKQDVQQTSYLWGAMGAKYMPSVLYKMRMVTIKDGSFNLNVPLSGFGLNS